ncbi:hypothetical protein HDV05_001833 [Chytridiales sp. JEL 0842]|nr:hypothetical protein HDV05_001833 [Chytridiales sp. JEL 0842]
MISHLIYTLFSTPIRKKCVIIELTRRIHINYLRPTLQRLTSKRKRSTPNFIPEVEGLDYLYAPLYAAGRVVVGSMLDSILFQLFKNPSLLETLRLLCGSRTKADEVLDRDVGVERKFLCQIDVPEGYAGRTFGELYRELTVHHGMIPLGLYREADEGNMGNRLPFVYTNPIASVLLKDTDVVFVLSAVIE